MASVESSDPSDATMISKNGEVVLGKPEIEGYFNRMVKGKAVLKKMTSKAHFTHEPLLGPDEGGGDDVHIDSVRCPLGRQLPAQGNQAAFSRTISGISASTQGEKRASSAGSRSSTRGRAG